MRLNPFGKKSELPKKTDTEKDLATTSSKDEGVDVSLNIDSKDSNLNRVIKNLYVSEKASILAGSNKYVFKVHSSTNKSEVKKQVSKIFRVKVVDVKILNMPSKRRDIGRYPGVKPGYKKAIVTLEKGQTINQGQQKAS